MKNVFLELTAAIVLLFVSCDENSYQKMIEDELAKGEAIVQEEETAWQLVWEQNFDLVGIKDDPASWDPDAWSKIPRGAPDWQVHMSSFDSCYAFRNGNLILRGIKNSKSTPATLNDPSAYLTGGYWTKGKKSFGLGRIEIRAKLQAAQGAWPAIWMLPESNLAWPLGGEIDIMERVNKESRVHQTVHTYYTSEMDNKTDPVSSKTFNNMTLPNTYNVYAMEKYQDSLVFYVNTYKTFVYPRKKGLLTETEKLQYPFADHDFYLILSMQLGGTWAGAIEPTEMPNEMYIDWIRFYELKEE